MQIDLDNSWSIGEEAFGFVCSLIRETEAKNLLEFGSGASTIRLALEFCDLSIVSVEHDREHYERTCDQVRAYGLQARVLVQDAPLTVRWIRGRPFLTYNFSHPCQRFDFVVVDGPPWSTRRGREACLYFSEPLLKGRATIVLDDSTRQDEATIVRNWQAVYRGAFSFQSYHIGHGLTVLRRNEREARPRFSLSAFLDAHWAMLQSLRSEHSHWLRTFI